MNHMDRRVRLLALGGVVILALAATLLLAPPEGSLSVDEVMDDPNEFTGDAISIRGLVMNGSWQEGDTDFTLEGENELLHVDFSGVSISSGFSEGKTILVTGELLQSDGEWIFHAEEIQVGCPSKYEAETADGGEHPDNVTA